MNVNLIGKIMDKISYEKIGDIFLNLSFSATENGSLVFRFQRCQTANPHPPYGYSDTEDILVTTFKQGGEQVDQCYFEKFVEKIMQRLNTPSFIKNKFNQKIQNIKSIFPDSMSYVIAGAEMSESRPVDINLLFVRLNPVPDEIDAHTHTVEDSKSLRNMLTQYITKETVAAAKTELSE